MNGIAGSILNTIFLAFAHHQILRRAPMAYDTVTSQRNEKQFRDLNRVTKEYVKHASGVTEALKAFKLHVDGMHEAGRKIRCGFTLEPAPSKEQIDRAIGREVARVADLSLFSFADVTLASLTTMPDKIPSLSAMACTTVVALGKTLSAAHDAVDKKADNEAAMAYIGEVKARLKNNEGKVP